VIAVIFIVIIALRMSSAAERKEAAGTPAGLAGQAGPPTAKALSGPKVSAGFRNPLGTAAASYLATRAGTIVAAVYDLDEHRIWTIGASRPQAEASIVKLDILEALLARRGNRGSGLSVHNRNLAQLMIEDSDNDAATALWHAVGGAAGLRAFNAAAGLAGTSPSSCVSCPGFPWPGWGLTTTVPVDQIALLRQAVQPGALLTRAQRRYVLRLLENVTPGQRWGVTGGVPAGVTVALKNGWLPLNHAGTDWQINSVGWISGRGRNYLMAVLSTGNPAESYGIGTIDGLSALVWRRMG
jgi:hypothetical protein